MTQEYTPTTDEIDTGYTTFAWELAKESPGEYPEWANFTDYHEVCAAFRRWLAEERMKAKAGAWDEGCKAGMREVNDVLRGRPNKVALNPYRTGETNEN